MGKASPHPLHSHLQTQMRKLEHIRITIDSPVEHKLTTLLDEIYIPHQAIPEASLEEVNTSIIFLGKRLSAPIIVTGMTGGHEATASINCEIARAVEELGLAMGVGSQRAAIEDDSLAWTFRAARDCAPTAPIIANIGAPQLVKGYSIKEITRAIEMINADAIAIHLNAAQEVFQPEGDTNFKGVAARIAKIVEEIEVPVIVKETGHGLSYESVYMLASKGVKYFDVSGAGGTSWILVEKYRNNDEQRRASANVFESWGIPTSLSIIETRWAAPAACIIASGGIRSGLDVARALALGADLAGIALPVLRAYARGGGTAVRGFLERVLGEFKTALFLAGCNKLECLRRTRIALGPRLLQLVKSRGIDLGLYVALREVFSSRC